MCSKTLLESEDGGMVNLLILQDFINEVIRNRQTQQTRDDSEGVDSHATQTVTLTGQTAYSSGDMGVSSIQTVPVINTANMVNQPHNVGAASQTGPVISIPDSKFSDTFSVSSVRTSELQEMLSSYEELGKRLRQSIMVPTEQSPQHTTGLPVQAN